MNPANENVIDPSFQMLSRLGRRLAHELNNPISAISSSVYLIQDILSTGTANGLEIEPFLTSIQEECESLKLTIQEFSKFASTTSILPSHIDLSEFVRKRAEEMAREGLPVRANVPNQQSFADADAGALSFVFRSIADTAQNAGATEIIFSLDNTMDNTIHIADNRNRSTTSEELSSSFSSDVTLERRQGLGLKLPLAKRIVEMHHGTIEFPASDDGRTHIEIRIPKSS